MAAVLVLISAGVMAVLLAALLAGTLAPWTIGLGWVIGAAAAAAAWRAQRSEDRWEQPGPLGWFILACAALFVLRTSFWLAWEQGADLRVGSPKNLGDFALHFVHVAFLERAPAFWPLNPIAAADPLTYPPGMALWTVMLDRAGFSLFGAFAFGSLLGLGLGVAACWRWGGAFAVAVLLCNGGLAGWAALQGGAWIDFQDGQVWKNIPHAMLTTQRGLLYALPAGLWLLVRWREVFVRAQGAWGWTDWWLYCTLPLFHAHTFLALSLLLGVWFLAGLSRRALLGYVGAAFPVAALLLWQVTNGFAVGGGLRWDPGWIGEGGSVVKSLIFSYGAWLAVLPALALLTGWRWWRRREPAARETAAFLWPGCGLLGICGLVVFQPWAWDNTKLMLWGWLLAAPMVWQSWLVDVVRAWRAPVLFALFFSGWVSLIGGLLASREGYGIANRVELSDARMAARQLRVDEPVAAAPDYNHVLLLAGQPLVLGYDGHLWSHGIDYRARMGQLEALMHGGPDWRERADELDVDYLFWGLKEEQRFPGSVKGWSGEAVVHRGPAGTLYRIRQDGAP
ncbi:MAG: hypothetical protein KIT44_10960 [Opitutaceae bacterium]|nr:hypothetical protein [Opitutaceae bacterium]